MGYCVVSDVEAALGRPLPLDLDVTTLIESASDCVDAYINMDIPQPTPGVVIRVTAESVANVINRPQPHVPLDMPDPYNAPAFQYQIGPQSLGPWLNGSQKDRLSVLRVALRSVQVYSETTGYFTRFGIGDISASTESLDMLAPPAGS